MVFFCPDCQYTLGISKSSTLEDYDDERKEISNVNEVFKLIEKDVDFSDYKTNILKTDLIKNKKYTKLNNSQKNNINQLFSSKMYDADLNCANCGYRKQISSTIKLYEFNVSDKTSNVRTLEDNKLLTLDPTLPRTRDFTCKNVNCTTHKNKENKEAVFVRIPKSYNLSYICTTCYYSWNTV